MIYIGIDIGKNGGICTIKENGIKDYFIMPLSKSREIELKTIIDYLLDCRKIDNILIGIEDLKPIFGIAARSNGSLMRDLGLIEGMLITLGLSYVKIPPKEWQKFCFTGIDAVYKKNTKVQKDGKEPRKILDTKAMASLAVHRLFPDMKFVVGTRSEKEHDGIIDALLIAYYLKCTRK